MAIRAALIFNNHGKPRLTRFYSQLPTSRQQALLQRTFALVHKRTTQGVTSAGREVCNFLDAPELRPLLPPPAMRSAAGASAASTSAAAASSEYDAAYDHFTAETKSAAMDTTAANGRRKTAANADGSTSVYDDQLRVIYRHYATLYFVFIVDESESELGILDLIQVFVEALDRSFENVCELDLIFHFDEVHAILDEIIQGGLVLETNIGDIAQSALAAARARKASAATSGVAGSSNSSAASGNGLGGMSGSSGALGALGWTPAAGLGGVPWGDAAANVGGWAREWGARIGGGGASAAGGASGRLRY